MTQPVKELHRAMDGAAPGIDPIGATIGLARATEKTALLKELGKTPITCVLNEPVVAMRINVSATRFIISSPS
jgi:hypothetical protein